MGSLGNYAENKMLDLIFGAVAFTPTTAFYCALGTACSDSGITELTGNNYGRQTVYNYNNTKGANYWAPAADGSKVYMGYCIWTGIATPNAWSTATYWAFFDHPTTTTNMYAWGDISGGGITVAAGQHAILLPGTLTITLD